MTPILRVARPLTELERRLIEDLALALAIEDHGREKEPENDEVTRSPSTQHPR